MNLAGPPECQRDEYGRPLWSGWPDGDKDFQTLRALITETQCASLLRVTPMLSGETLNITAAKMVLEGHRELIHWLRELPYYYETDRRIFVHAGYIGTVTLSGGKSFHDIFWDGESHYYIDGTVHVSKRLPVLMYDGETGRYTSLGGGLIEIMFRQ